ncbi:MAG TPA: FKBP-type peptidyl-prolyl cis-trans isomerase [Rhizomicrobium sp.]|jgi:FKBP-type peptidyl-prolyl cis-trans isomerase|nr:FKBP-type peptidyl-prolyl cis-trans isomerase [Rhizomicrobium sp.]
MRLAIALATVMAVVSVPVLAADASLSVAANQAFLAANAKKHGVIITPDGLQYRIIQNGYGKRPGALDQVTVYYKGQLINGKVFDATEPGLPTKFVTDKLIPGWTEALQLMREGDHWELVIPPALAYGTRGVGDGMIPPDQDLVFDLQLVKVEPPMKDPHDEDDQDQGR